MPPLRENWCVATWRYDSINIKYLERQNYDTFTVPYGILINFLAIFHVLTLYQWLAEIFEQGCGKKPYDKRDIVMYYFQIYRYTRIERNSLKLNKNNIRKKYFLPS